MSSLEIILFLSALVIWASIMLIIVVLIKGANMFHNDSDNEDLK